jgi:hypothetical protein
MTDAIADINEKEGGGAKPPPGPRGATGEGSPLPTYLPLRVQRTITDGIAALAGARP